MIAGRPTLIKGKNQLLFDGMQRLGENVTLNLKKNSHAVTAEVWVPDKETNGVIITQGGYFGGWSLYVKDGILKYCYNLLGVQRFYTAADTPLPAGKHQVRMEFAYEGSDLGSGGAITLFLDGNKVGRGYVGATQPMFYSLDETTDVGCETGTMVAEGYTAQIIKFNGKIEWVQLDQGSDDQDHLISPEERYRWHWRGSKNSFLGLS